MVHDVFLCYASRDKTAADAMCARLEGDGVRCWIAPRDILPGRDWSEAIIEGIEGSQIMLLAFSSNSNSSQQVKREVERAVNKGLIVIPVRIEDVLPSRSIEYFLSTPHWLDAMTPPFERHLGRVSETVRLLLSRSADKPPPAPRPLEPSTIVPAPPRRRRYARRFGAVAFAIVGIGSVLGVTALMRDTEDSAPTATVRYGPDFLLDRTPVVGTGAASHGAKVNVLTNTTFDSNVSGWGIHLGFPTTSVGFFKGTAKVTNLSDLNTATSGVASQCVSVDRGATYFFSYEAYIPSGQERDGGAHERVFWYEAANCTGRIVAAPWGPNKYTAQRTWIPSESIFIVPMEAASAEVMIAAMKDTPKAGQSPNGPFLVHFDNVEFGKLVPSLAP